MKKILFILALLLMPIAANAWTIAPWTRADTAREVGYDALLVLDSRQTHWAATSPGFYEANPLLGRHPSSGEIDRHFIEAAALHGIVSVLLPDIYRTQWQWGTIAVEGFVIGHNAWIGARISF